MIRPHGEQASACEPGDRAKTHTLTRRLRSGERVSFDNGRISLSLEDKSGRTARLKLTLAEDVVVDKPSVSANDEPKNGLLLSAREA